MLENASVVITPEFVNLFFSSLVLVLGCIFVAFFGGMLIGYIAGDQMRFKKFRKLSILRRDITVEQALNYFREME